MVDPLPLNQTTRPWNPSPRRIWHTCQPSYSACYCASRAMTTLSITTPVKMALPDTLSCFSPCPCPDTLLDIAIHHACLSPEWKGTFQQAFMSDPEMHALTNIIISWPNDIKVVPCPLHPTDNIMRPSLSKMALSSVEKPSLFLLWKGRENYTSYTSSINESPNPSCSCMDVSSGPV